MHVCLVLLCFGNKGRRKFFGWIFKIGILALNCQRSLLLLELAGNLFELSKTSLNLFKLVWTCWNLFELVETCLNLLKLALTCWNLLELVQTCLNLFKLAWTCWNSFELVWTCWNSFNLSKLADAWLLKFRYAWIRWILVTFI